MAKKSRSRKAVDPPPDDACEPALLTPRRMAGELERAALDVTRAQQRLRRLAAYVDNRRFLDLAESLSRILDQLGDLAGRVLTGQVEIVAGRDEAAGRDRYPLLESRPNGQVANIATSERLGTEPHPEGPETLQDEAPPAQVSTSGVMPTKATRAKRGAGKAKPEKFAAGAIRIVPVELTGTGFTMPVPLVDDVEQLLELESDADAEMLLHSVPDDPEPTADWKPIAIQERLPEKVATMCDVLDLATAGQAAEWVEKMERCSDGEASRLTGYRADDREFAIKHIRAALEAIRPESDPQPAAPKPRKNRRKPGELMGVAR